jgi:hypothetical protein
MAWSMNNQIQVGQATKPKLAKHGKKNFVFRDEDYRRLVASVPCVVCGAPSQACHRNEGKGMGIKASDAMLFACCPTHHVELDANNKLPKTERRALENEYCVKTFVYLIENKLLRIA